MNSKRKIRFPFWIAGVFAAFAAAYLCSAFLIQVMLIQGDSMLPAFHDKQIVFLDKMTRSYLTGDVIAFRCDNLGCVLVKRIAGLPGDEIIIDGKLYVVPENCLFVLGDNREASVDSRSESVGYVDRETVIGKIIQ